jgi:hypothetical protein
LKSVVAKLVEGPFTQRLSRPGLREALVIIASYLLLPCPEDDRLMGTEALSIVFIEASLRVNFISVPAAFLGTAIFIDF